MKKINKELKDCSREDLIKIIANMSLCSIDYTVLGCREETSNKLKHIGTQAITECDRIGWDFE